MTTSMLKPKHKYKCFYFLTANVTKATIVPINPRESEHNIVILQHKKKQKDLKVRSPFLGDALITSRKQLSWTWYKSCSNMFNRYSACQQQYPSWLRWVCPPSQGRTHLSGSGQQGPKMFWIPCIPWRYEAWISRYSWGHESVSVCKPDKRLRLWCRNHAAVNVASRWDLLQEFPCAQQSAERELVIRCQIIKNNFFS